MKNGINKIIKSVSCLAAVLLIVGCKNQGKPLPPKTEIPANSQSLQTPIPSAEPTVGLDMTLLMDGTQRWGQQGTKEGYYDIALMEDGRQIIYYTDYEQKIQVPLCASPNCMHDSDQCTAWTTTRSLFVYDGYLYLLYSSFDGASYLERRDLDGGNRETIVRLASNKNFVPTGITAAGDDLFFAVLDVEADSINTTYSICKLNLSTGECSEIQSREDANQFIVGVLEDKIVIERFEVDEKSLTKLMPEFLLMDQQGKETPIMLPSWVTETTWILPEKGELLLHNSLEGSIVKLDILTGNLTTLAKDPRLKEYPTATVLLASFDNGVILNIDQKYYLCKDGQMKESNHCYYRGDQRSNKILEQLGDQYLVCRDFDTSPKTLAITSKEDYWDDKDSDLSIRNSD